MKKKKGSSAIGYVMIFTMAIIMVIVTMYMMSAAKLMTTQYDIDDALADSVLASLVADDVYYFKTRELTGSPVVRFRDVNDSYKTYKECMNAALGGSSDFYKNLRYEAFLSYEVEGDTVKVTSFNSSGGKSVTSGSLGSVRTPNGIVVTKTGCYGKVIFDLEPVIGGNPITKSRDLFCTLEIND